MKYKNLLIGIVLLLPLAGVLSIGLLPNSLNAQEAPQKETLDIYCLPTKLVIEGLQSKFKESPVAIGDSGKSTTVIWLNRETKQFTITVTTEDRTLTCIIVSGDNFEHVMRGTKISNEKPNRFY